MVLFNFKNRKSKKKIKINKKFNYKNNAVKKLNKIALQSSKNYKFPFENLNVLNHDRRSKC